MESVMMEVMKAVVQRRAEQLFRSADSVRDT